MCYLSILFAGEIEYDAKTEAWIELTSSFINEKNSLPIFSLLLALKTYIPRNNVAKKSRTIYNSTNRH